MAKIEDANKDQKENNNNALSVMKQIKEAEQKKRKVVVEVVDKEKKVSFEVWWMKRSPFIPKQHRKEILRADFTGRGLGDKELDIAFDAALEKYGVKIK
jgi:hypothetical protein